MQRRVELDALRGLMLVWITFTHLPTNLSRYVNQPFGFFAATEGFIFLSALFTGLIYSRLAERDGLAAMCRKLWMRAGRLYSSSLRGDGYQPGTRLRNRNNRTTQSTTGKARCASKLNIPLALRNSKGLQVAGKPGEM